MNASVHVTWDSTVKPAISLARTIVTSAVTETMDRVLYVILDIGENSVTPRVLQIVLCPVSRRQAVAPCVTPVGAEQLVINLAASATAKAARVTTSALYVKKVGTD